LIVKYQYVEEVTVVCGRGRGANRKNTVENPNTQLKDVLVRMVDEWGKTQDENKLVGSG